MSTTMTFNAYQIIETGKLNQTTGKPITYWNRVGTAWVNRDGSINVQLNCLPLDGKVQLRAQNEEQ